MLLPGWAKPKKNTDCISGTSVAPAPAPPPPPTPAAHDPLNPMLPPNRWGPYVGRKAQLAPEYGFVSGFDHGCGWPEIETVRGRFNFSDCESAVQEALAQNKYVIIGAGTGVLPWMEEAGVPIVRVCFKEKDATCAPDDIREYPFYLSRAYLPLWRRFQQALHDWVKQLPRNAQGFSPVQAIQVKLGSTGDITPWHGTPLDSKYHIDGAVWKEFWVNGSRIMWEIHRDLLPDTKLLFNGVPTNSTPEPDNPDAKYWPAYRELIFDIIRPPNFDMKQGVVSHEYMTTNEHDDWLTQGNITRFPYVNAATGRTEFVRTRGESSDGGIKVGKGKVGGPGIGFWMNPTWNLLAMMCWDITCNMMVLFRFVALSVSLTPKHHYIADGLDVQNPNPAMWTEENNMNKCPPAPPPGGQRCSNWTKTLWRPFQHFHTHAGQKVASEAPGGWLQLRDALDYADTERFPVAQFGGPATRKNTARLQRIVQQYSGMGAIVEDVASASGSRHFSRSRKGINNAGWRIWPYNYGQWMEQIDPLGTSVGRWGVGSQSNLLGQSTRQTIPGKNMSFVLTPGLFAKREPAAGLFVRVGYFDEGTGGWQLYYASSGGAGGGVGGMRLAAHVQKTDTREFIEIRVRLNDLDLGLLHGAAVHFSLVDSDVGARDPDVFAWIEVLASPFLYQMAEVVHELGTVP